MDLPRHAPPGAMTLEAFPVASIVYPDDHLEAARPHVIWQSRKPKTQ